MSIQFERDGQDVKRDDGGNAQENVCRDGDSQIERLGSVNSGIMRRRFTRAHILNDFRRREKALRRERHNLFDARPDTAELHFSSLLKVLDSAAIKATGTTGFPSSLT